MSAPIRLAFDVACSSEHAFTVWTEAIGTWWPPDHTVTGQPDLQVVLQGAVGGRIFERTADGAEHDWGVVTVWRPPSQLAYRWHLRRDPADATEVEIRFVDLGPAATRVEIEHRGWDRPAPDREEWRQRNVDGWDTLLPHYRAALTGGDHR